MSKENKFINQDKITGMLVMAQYFMANKIWLTLKPIHSSHSKFRELSQLDKDQILSRQKFHSNQFWTTKSNTETEFLSESQSDKMITIQALLLSIQMFELKENKWSITLFYFLTNYFHHNFLQIYYIKI